MCGLSGFLTTAALPEAALRSRAQQMAQAIAHRGPDDYGSWADSAAGVALGHRRLAIVDLSAAGHQPMVSASGRFVIAFNGEIYNHLDIRRQLDVAGGMSRPWRGHSDTETLLAAFELWGVQRSLAACVGMFAVALWDRQSRTLCLARDRFGEKPLYYGWLGNDLAFASELKALRAHPGFANLVRRESLAQYLRLMYVPAPATIYQDVYKLQPGTLLEVDASGFRERQLDPRPYWSWAAEVEAGQHNRFASDAEALHALEPALADAVRLQMLADVPLGAFLSGGVDSSLIVALMQQQASRPVQTFTVGFEQADFDEAPYARAVARHLGTDHHEMYVTAAQAQSVIPGLPAMYDEPFADSSQIPTHLVCGVARQHVTVALSGDAGDELFGGYNRYLWGPRVWRRVRWMPHSVRHMLASGLQSVPPATLDRIVGSRGVVRPGEKLHKLARALRGTRSLDDLYGNLVSEWGGGIVYGLANDRAARLPRAPVAVEDGAGRMMYWDTLTYLPDDILCKVDRAAMAVSLETRVPFLDHRVAQLACRLPASMKVRGGQGKWALRQLLYKRVPRELIERPKAGFALPLAQWLRGPLRSWAEELLDEKRLQREAFLNPVPIRDAWRQHLSGRYDWTPRLWSVLMFQAWLEKNS
jgi:asparagine synthase (glutamine-hydrolysing)